MSADYLAHMLDGESLTYRDLQLLGLRQCYVATTDGQRPLAPVLVTLPPPPSSSPAAARLIAAACAALWTAPRRRRGGLQVLADCSVPG
jgi:hypothetical protein